MPTYTLRNKITGEEDDVICTYDELQELLESGVCERVFKPNPFITMTGGTLSKTSSAYRDNLKRIKSEHPGSPIKT